MRILKKCMRLIALMLYLVLALFPLCWIIITSLKNTKEIYSSTIIYLPQFISFDSYRDLLGFTDFAIYFRNSLMVALIASLLVIFITIFSAYALSRWVFSFKTNILVALFFTQSISLWFIMAPLYTTFSKIGMIDNLITLIILYTCRLLPFSVIMIKSFFERIPNSIEDAARIDGCNRWQTLSKIIFPLALPGLSATFSFCFIYAWNELFLAVMFINSNTKMTVPVALNSFITKAGIGWDLLSAGIVVSLIPTIIVFALTQRYIVAGLTRGAIKG